MSKTIDPSNHLFFRYRSEKNLIVTVPSRYGSVIEAAREEYGDIENVPPMKTVRGIFAKRSGDRYTYMDSNMQENDITINRLELLAD